MRKDYHSFFFNWEETTVNHFTLTYRLRGEYGFVEVYVQEIVAHTEYEARAILRKVVPGAYAIQAMTAVLD